MRVYGAARGNAVADVASDKRAQGDGSLGRAQLVKFYGASPESATGRYSPAQCTGIVKTGIEGKPDPKHNQPSFVGRRT